MQRKYYIYPLLAIPVVALVGYAVMKGLMHALPLSEGSTVLQVVAAIVILVLAISVPYWMLKLGFVSAHARNRHEKEISLTDIPKDKQQVASSRK